MSSDTDIPEPLEPSLVPKPADYDHERPWERQPCDSDRRWHAFVVYREIRGARSLRRAWELLLASDPSGKWCARGLERWSAEDGWVDRVRAYDVWRDEEWQRHVSELLSETARERAGRHIDLLRQMQQLATMACREILADAIKPGAKLRWAPREIARVVKEALTLERLVFGEVTERTETSVGFDLTRLTFQEIEQLRMLEAKAGMAE